jgi:outer membrane receptor protein involved in Fe transport
MPRTTLAYLARTFVLLIAAGTLLLPRHSRAAESPVYLSDDPVVVDETTPSEPAQPPVDAPDDGEEPAGLEDELPADLLEIEQLFREAVSVSVPTVAAPSRREEKATASPATVIVISRREIVRRGYSQLTDVLRDLPGMETIEYHFSEQGTQVPVRGISGNNKIGVLVNGMRVNPPGGENFPFRSDFSVRHAERIEVVYGSASTLYGQDAISAIVNVVMQKPTGGSSIEVGGEAGVHLEREIWGWYGGELACCRDIKVSGFVQYHDSDLTPIDREFPAYWQDYRNVASGKTNGNGLTPARKDYGLNLYGRVEGFNSSFQVWHRQSQRSSAEGFSPILGFLPQAKWGDSSTVMEGKNTQDFGHGISLESRLTYNGYEINPSSRYVFPASDTAWFLDDFKYGRGWRLGLEETLQWEVTDRLTFLIGGLARYSDIIPKSTIAGGYDPSMGTVAQGDFFYYSQTPGGALTPIPQVSQSTFWTYSAYSEGQLQLLDWLRLVGGVRVTWDGHYEDVPVTPRASVIVDLTDRITAKYIYNRGFVQPAPYFAFSTFDNGTLLATVNDNVDPETAETHEINLTYYGDDLMLGFSAYHGIQSNIITLADRRAPQNIVDPLVYLNGDGGEPRVLVQTANGGDSERYGFDLYGKWDHGCLSSWVSYSYVDFEERLVGSSSGLPGISKHNGRFGVTWEATEKLFITPSLVIRSTPENVFPGRLARELDTPWEINLYALYRYTECCDLFVDFRNITDHHYALGGFTGTAIPQETFRCVGGLRFMY